MDEILCLCMEADINIQHITYEILQENYTSLLEDGENASKETNEKKFIDKLRETAKEFFKKVLDAMKRMAIKILSLSKKMKTTAMASDINGKMKDIKTPKYRLSMVMDWASNQIYACDNNGVTEYTSFEEFAGDALETIPGKYSEEKSILDSYDVAIKFVKAEAKRVQSNFTYQYSKHYEKSDRGKDVLKTVFQIQKQAISLIQKRTNDAVNYIAIAMKRSYVPLMSYKKLG